MKKLLLLTALCVASPAFSADWTPYVKSMQNGCDADRIWYILTKNERMPNALRKDVISHTTPSGTDGYGTFTLNLKNAKAFGYPLKKIVHQGLDYGGGVTTLFFDKADFGKLVPTFSKTIGNTKVVARSNKAFEIKYKVNEDEFIDSYDDLEIISVKEIKMPTLNKEYSDGLYKYYNTSQYTDNHSVVLMGTTNGWHYSYQAFGDASGVRFFEADNRRQTLSCGG